MTSGMELRQKVWRHRLGRVGVWLAGQFEWASDPAGTARLVERSGYGALWIGGGTIGGQAVERIGRAVEATTSLVVATGIANVWARPAERMVADAARLGRSRAGGFLLGLGISHQPVVEWLGHTFERPYAHMVRYLDEMDRLVPADDPAWTPRVLAALGPRMLRLARERAVGAHPYFVPPEHTERARAELGPTPLLAPEMAFVLEQDPASARAAARGYAALYLQLPNYVENLRRLGFGDDDLTGGGSDRLIDAVVPWGDEAAIVAAVRAHLDAGADHVCVQPVVGDGLGLEVLQRLGPALTSL